MPSSGQDTDQYAHGAHRDLGADQVGKAQISFNVPVSATSRTAHGRPGLATTADRPGQEGPSAGRWTLAACAEHLLFPHLVGRSPRHHQLSGPRRNVLGRSRADSRPQPVSMATISHISRGNLGPAAPPAAHPAAASLRPAALRHGAAAWTPAGARADTRLNARLVTSRRPEADRW